MVAYGAAPSGDELELSLFGPGYGEAVAVHFGDSNWALVDSCEPSEIGQPASLHYLQSIGVSPELVKVVVASHWHDDHVKGIASLVAACSNATFFYSNVFSNREALAFLAAYGDADVAPQSGGARELFKVIRGCTNPRVPTCYRTDIFSAHIQGRDVRMLGFAPTAQAQEYSLQRMAQYLAAEGQPINHAPELKPNVESVVLHIDFGDDAVILGADLENYKSLGWTAIVGDSWCLSQRKATLYKVAHHGSKTADLLAIWDNLFEEQVMAALTPFNLGSVKLPETDDRKRIRQRASASFISSKSSRRPILDRQLLRKMNRICNYVTTANPGFGALRFRRGRGARSWSVETFGKAGPL